MRARNVLMTFVLSAGMVFSLGGCVAENRARSESASTLIKEGRAFILDVRTPREFEGGHLLGAKNVPHDKLMERLQEIPSDRSTPIVIYCRSGRRSELAKELLSEVGYTTVINAGGLEDLKKRDPSLPMAE